jgi:UDP-N-acetylmuramoyl-L-alanyl-D-glutamate--2,6-diaminopimelate ligase
VSVFTNLSREHGDFHKTIEDYYQAKRKLANISKKMIVNMDDPYGQRMYTECEGAVGVGAIYDADVQIKSIRRCDFSGSEYLYSGGNFVFIAKTRLPGIFNVYNTALALTAVTELGIKPCLAKRALSKLEGVEGRFEIIAECPKVIIDYAHTPMALETVLCAIKQMATCNRITLVFGAGGERDKEKRPEMAKIAEKYAKNIIVTTDNTRNESKDSIIKDITRGFTEKAQYKVINDRTEAINYAIDNASDDEIIAIVGKGAEDYIIDKYGYRPYSDKACATEAISRRKRNDRSANKA